MHAEERVTNDGRHIIRVTFQREGEETDLPVIVATYHVLTPDDFSILDGQHVIEFLASVDKDTLEPIPLTPQEKRRVLSVVTSKAAEHDPDW